MIRKGVSRRAAENLDGMKIFSDAGCKIPDARCPIHDVYSVVFVFRLMSVICYPFPGFWLLAPELDVK
ncbi:MAG TPA: hypothetical protein DCO77_13480 [Nitrospiraceae bacterium]|nr:hypothetical protein [Nitrospiraceae bacterium]